MTDRGVSEVLGFVLVFSLIVTTVGIVYVGGMSGLTDTRDTERINNAERAFDVLADNFQQLGRAEAPSRATEIRIAGGQLSTSRNYPLVTNRTDDPDGETKLNPVSIEYSTGGSKRIVYELGAVIRTSGEGAGVMLREPDLIFDEDRTVLRYIEPRGSGQAIGGTTTVLVRAQTNTVETLDEGSGGQPVRIRLQTAEDRANIWKEYFEEQLEWETDPCSVEAATGDDSVVVCTFDTDVIYVAHVRMQVEIS